MKLTKLRTLCVAVMIFYQNQNMQIFSPNQTESIQSQNYIKYSIVLQSYCNLSQDYYRLSQQNQKLKDLISQVEEKTKKINDLILKEHIQHSNIPQATHTKKLRNETFGQQKHESQNKIDISMELNSQKKRVRKPSQKRYKCPFEDCGRLYDTSVSLNLHMKLKHNAGTKKQRQVLANSIIQAIEKGQQPPQAQIVLPPEYLEQYKTKKLFKQKYSM